MQAILGGEGELFVRRRDTLFSDTFAKHRNSTQNYDVFPDGKSFLMIQQTSHVPHLAVIRNWTAMLRNASP
jgi:hypothetical protein